MFWPPLLHHHSLYVTQEKKHSLWKPLTQAFSWLWGRVWDPRQDKYFTWAHYTHGLHGGCLIACYLFSTKAELSLPATGLWVESLIIMEATEISHSFVTDTFWVLTEITIGICVLYHRLYFSFSGWACGPESSNYILKPFPMDSRISMWEESHLFRGHDPKGSVLSSPVTMPGNGNGWWLLSKGLPFGVESCDPQR